MSRKPKGQPVSRAKWTADIYKAVPELNRAAVRSKLETGVIITVPIRRPGYMVPPLSWILPFSPSRRVELDAAGAAMLDLCDGRRTVEAIVEKFAADHKLSFREAQLPVMQFLRQLVDRGVLAVVGRKKDEQAQ